MTTIAYNHKDKQISVDSQCTDGSTIMSSDQNKVFKKDGLTFILAGGTGDIKKFIESYPNITEKSDAAGFIIEDGEVVLVSVVDKELCKSPVTYNDANGCGFKWALAAMDFGKTAKEAVEYAITRDIYTGGKVHVYDIEEGKFI